MSPIPVGWATTPSVYVGKGQDAVTTRKNDSEPTDEQSEAGLSASLELLIGLGRALLEGNKALIPAILPWGVLFWP